MENTEDTYNSSFESSSSSIVNEIIPKKKDENALDLKLLSEAVRELQRLNGQGRVPLKLGKAEVSKEPSACCSVSTETIKSSESQINKRKMAKIKTVLPSRRCSAEINRRKQHEKIERENLILLRKLHSVKPSTEITAWKKSSKSNVPSALSTRTNSRIGQSSH